MGGNLAAFIKKEFIHIFRDRWTLLIIIGMPIVQLLLFGFAISTEISNVDIAVFDGSQDVLTGKIIDRIDRSRYFNVVEKIDDPQRINAVFREGRADAVLVFDSAFARKAEVGEEARMQIIMDGSDPNRASMINAYLNGILASCRKDIGPEASAAGVTPTVRMLYNPQGKSAYNFVPGVMGLILMLICAMMTAVAIVREKESGSMEVLLSSPVSPLGIIIAKAIPYLALSFLDLCIILLCATTVLDVPVAGSLTALLVVSALFLACTLGIGLLISTVAKTQMAAMIISSVGLLMPTMLLSGLMFPIESMPAVLQWISAAVPARWYIQAVKIIMIQGAPVRCAMTEIGVLLLMTLVVTAASVKNFKTRII